MMTPEEFAFYAADVRRAGFIRRRLRGGYKMTAVKGKVYLRDAVQRHDELRAELSKQIDNWEAGAMTKAEKREALVALIVLAWKKDREGEAEAAAELRSSGVDVLAPDLRAELRKLGVDPADNRVWRRDDEQS